MSARQQFEFEIEAFLVRTGMSASALGLQTMNDHRFVARLRAGARVTVETMDKIKAFMEAYRERGPLARESRAA